MNPVGVILQYETFGLELEPSAVMIINGWVHTPTCTRSQLGGCGMERKVGEGGDRGRDSLLSLHIIFSSLIRLKKLFFYISSIKQPEVQG